MAASLRAMRMFPPLPKTRAIAGQPPGFLWGTGTPDGTIADFSGQPIGSIYIQSDGAAGVSALWQKLASNAANADWVPQTVASQVPISATGSALAVTRALHAGRVITLNRAAGIAVTLPVATGTGDKYTFIIGTTFTGAASIAVADATDYMVGNALLGIDGGTAVPHLYPTANTGTLATESDTLSLFGTANSQGGFKGQRIEFVDIATDIWAVQVVGDAGGTEATPFSAAV